MLLLDAVPPEALDVEPLEVPPVAVELVSLEAAGAVVELELVEGAVEGAGAGALDDGAGGGVTTVSSFLQAARPTAMQAARRRSERFMFFPLGTTGGKVESNGDRVRVARGTQSS